MAFRARGKEIINSIASVSTGKLPLYKKMWENPNPTSAFAAQPITLLSNDYDFLLCIYRRYSTANPESVVISEKGTDFDIEANYATSGGARVHTRSASIQNSGLTVSWSDSLVATGTTASSTNNNGCVPVAIYGFKKDVDIQSVIASVSTEASRCIMSDGVTNVEDAIESSASKTDIATVERGSTASRAYAIGELVYVNGNLYKVITAISGGATFTVGTNIQSTNVSGALNRVSVKSDTFSGTADGNGILTIPFRLNQGYIISARYSDGTTNGAIVPMIYNPYNTYALICLDSVMAKLTNTNVTVTWWYIEL